MKNPDLSLFLPSLTAGGAPRIMINVGKYLHEKGYSVEFVLSEAKGEFINDLGSMPIFDLDSRVIRPAHVGSVH